MTVPVGSCEGGATGLAPFPGTLWADACGTAPRMNRPSATALAYDRTVVGRELPSRGPGAGRVQANGSIGRVRDRSFERLMLSPRTYVGLPGGAPRPEGSGWARRSPGRQDEPTTHDVANADVTWHRSAHPARNRSWTCREPQAEPGWEGRDAYPVPRPAIGVSDSQAGVPASGSSAPDGSVQP